MTIEELAADRDFLPDGTGMPADDRKPFHRTSRRGGPGRARAADRTRCRVVGCGVPYAPAGVCGYCRGRVRQLRDAMLVTQSQTQETK